MFGIGAWEMLLIGVVALLVFGPKRLPELARSLGKGLAEFRRASSDLRRSIDLDLDPTRLSAPEPETQPPAQAGDPANPESDPPAEALSKSLSKPEPEEEEEAAPAETHPERDASRGD
jgi:TatA/E family protein of Tat protein translocase